MDRGLHSGMLETISHYIESISQTDTLEELKQALTDATQGLGFAGYNISLNKQKAVEFMEDPTLTTWTTRDLDAYANDNWAPRDPLLHGAVNSSTAFTWRADDWLDTPHHEYARYLQACGIAGGVTIPLSQARDKLGAMTLLSGTEDPLNRDTLLCARMIAHVTLARTSALTYDLPRLAPPPRGLASLSGHQMRILELVAKGKTNREIGIIMGRSTRTIDYHLREILSKLAVSSRAQAVAVLASRLS